MIPSIKLDSFSLNGNYVVKNITHDVGTPYSHNIMEISRQDGAKLINSSYSPKKIRVDGFIRGTSRDNLEENINTFKKNISVSEGNLIIEYSSGYRTYNVTCDSLIISRQPRDLLSTGFQVDFSVYSPVFGKSTDESGTELMTEMWSFENRTYAYETFSYEFDGTAKPKPVFTLSYDDNVDLDSFVFRNNTTNIEMYVNTLWETEDEGTVEFIFDSGKKEMIENNYRRNFLNTKPYYKGKFVENNPGINRYTIYNYSSNNPETGYVTGQVNNNSFLSTSYNLKYKQLAQSFKFTADTSGDTIRLAELFLNVNSNNATATVSIQSDNNSKPSGTILKSAVLRSNKIYADLQTGAEYSYGFVDFGSNLAITYNTLYWLVLDPGSSDYEWKWALQRNSGYIGNMAYTILKNPSNTDWVNIEKNSFNFRVIGRNVPVKYGFKGEYNKRYL